MKKTILTNISGMPFYIEEDAYQKLETYLNEIKKYFAKTEGKDEIISDIENRIAEKFCADLHDQNKVVTLSEVESVISSLGTVKDFDDSDENSTDSAANSTSEVYQKKLMRDPDNHVLGGVCAGVAAYLGIDVTLVRVIFIILFLAGGPGLLLYIILWIAMPEAKTGVDKMQMRGEPLTLASIEERVKNNVDGTAVAKESAVTSLILFPFRLIAMILKGIAGIIPAILVLMGVFVSIISSIVLFSITVAAGGLLFLHNSPNVDVTFANFPGTTTEYIAVILAYFAAAIPVFFVILLGVSLVKRKYVLNTLGTIALLVIWITSAATASVLGADIFPKLKQQYEASRVTKSVDNLSPFNKVKIGEGTGVTIKRGDVEKVEITGLQQYLDEVEVKTDNQELTVVNHDNLRVCIFCFKALSIDITTPNLEQITLIDAAHADVSGFDNLEQIQINLNDGASLDLHGSVQTLSAVIKDASRLEAYDFHARSANLEVRNGSSAKINATETVTAVITDASRLDAIDFHVRNANLEVSDGSSAKIYVTETLKVRAKDAARVRYRGGAVVDSSADDSSSVRMGE